MIEETKLLSHPRYPLITYRVEVIEHLGSCGNEQVEKSSGNRVQIERLLQEQQ